MPTSDKSVVVAGLDSGANRWHMVTSTGLIHQSGPLESKNKADKERWGDPDVRRHKLVSDLRVALMLLPAGSHVFCEEPLALQNGRTTRLLGLAAGALWATHLDFDLFWHWVNVSTWKKYVVGNGNATKDEVQAFILDLYGRSYAEEDLYDAHAIALYGAKALTDEGIDVLWTY